MTKKTAKMQSFLSSRASEATRDLPHRFHIAISLCVTGRRVDAVRRCQMADAGGRVGNRNTVSATEPRRGKRESMFQSGALHVVPYRTQYPCAYRRAGACSRCFTIPHVNITVAPSRKEGATTRSVYFLLMTFFCQERLPHSGHLIVTSSI